MKRILAITLIVCCLFLTACNRDIGIIGGADGPTSIIVTKRSYDIDRFFRNNYVDERKLPVLDIDIENPFVSDDRTLVLDDSIENALELMIYEYYKSLMSGSFAEAKDMIIDGSLLEATKAYENNFNDGIYYSKIVIDEIDLVDKDDLDEISGKNQQNIVELLNDYKMGKFAIVKVEKTIKHNEKSLSMVPQADMITSNVFNFAISESDQEILLYLKKYKTVEATREYLKTIWGDAYDEYAEIYQLEEIFAGKYHGDTETGDKTAEIKAYLDLLYTAEDVEDERLVGCVPVDSSLAELLQLLMDKYTFAGVEYSWAKLTYFYEYLGQNATEAE